jgi:hypothetical protein
MSYVSGRLAPLEKPEKARKVATNSRDKKKPIHFFIDRSEEDLRKKPIHRKVAKDAKKNPGSWNDGRME